MKLADYPEGIFSVIQGIAEGIGETIGKIGNVAAELGAGIHDSVVAGVSGIIGGVKDIAPSFSMGSATKAEEVALVRAPEIAAPSPHDVHPSELGGLSAPSFGSAAGGQSIGRA